MASDPGERLPKRKGKVTNFDKSHIFKEKEDASRGKPELPVPQAGSAVKGPGGPVVGLCGPPDVAKCQRHVVLANMRESTRTYPHTL